jgi:hypothetical protein
MNKIPLVLAIGVLISFLSCATTGPPITGGTPGKLSIMELDRKEYAGAAEAAGDTFLNARNKAVMSAVQKAVAELLGTEREASQRESLDQFLYNTKNPNAFIFTDTIANVRREMTGEDLWRYECTVDVNLVAVRNTLKANGLLGEEGASVEVATADTAGTPAAGTPGTAAADESLAAEGEIPAADFGELTAEERAKIARYVELMTFMVHFSDEIEEEVLYIRAAVGKANEYLSSLTLDTIDAAQIEQLKEDQQTVYEEETGESISIIQWIAQKLNADIYIEIFGRTEGSSQNGNKHYGEASIELKAYETSTAVLMGSASYVTLEKAFSQTSQDAARLNAIQAAVFKTMPRLIDQVKNNMLKALERGIRYEVVIQNPLGDRTMSRFWSRLKDRVKSTKPLAQSEEEVKYHIWFIGDTDELKTVIYDITDTIPGLENLELVLSRGKALTFNTGI